MVWKKMLVLLMVIVCLCSCTSFQQANTPVATSFPSFSNNESLDITFFPCRDGAPAKDGFYTATTRDDGSYNILYADYKTQQIVVLCNRPECTHDSESCTGWFPFNGGGVPPVVVGNKLIIVCCGSPFYYDTLGDLALPHIIQMDLNGLNAQTILTLEANQGLSRAFAADEKSIYCVLTSTKQDKGNVSLHYEIVRLNLESKEILSLGEVNNNAEIVGASGSNIYIRLTNIEAIINGNTEAQPINEIWRFSSDKVYSPQKLYSWDPFKKYGDVFGNFFFYINKNEQILHKINLTNGEDTIITKDFPSYSLINENFSFYYKGLFDNKLIVDMIDPHENMGPDTHRYYAIDIFTGEILKVKQEDTTSERPRLISILCEVSDSFFVNDYVESIPRNILAPDGNYVAVNDWKPHFSFIKKEDYWIGKKNFSDFYYLE